MLATTDLGAAWAHCFSSVCLGTLVSFSQQSAQRTGASLGCKAVTPVYRPGTVLGGAGQSLSPSESGGTSVQSRPSCGLLRKHAHYPRARLERGRALVAARNAFRPPGSSRHAGPPAPFFPPPLSSRPWPCPLCVTDTGHPAGETPWAAAGTRLYIPPEAIECESSATATHDAFATAKPDASTPARSEAEPEASPFPESVAPAPAAAGRSGPKADAWASGVVLLQLLSGECIEAVPTIREGHRRVWVRRACGKQLA
jgi:hypothetical protein